MWCLWSTKGGAGCTTVAATLAAMAASNGPTLLVDLGGDLPTVFGVAPPELGITDWMDADSPPPDGLGRLEVPLTDQLSLLPAGPLGPDVLTGIETPGGWTGTDDQALLAALLDSDERQVIVDVGLDHALGSLLSSFGAWSYLVTRACYLSTVRARTGPRPDGIIVVREQGRLLSDDDISSAWEAPVVVSLRWDPAVAVANDVGSLTQRPPRSLRRLSTLVQPDGVRS
jgi:hypothetical protein